MTLFKTGSYRRTIIAITVLWLIGRAIAFARERWDWALIGRRIRFALEIGLMIAIFAGLVWAARTGRLW